MSGLGRVWVGLAGGTLAHRSTGSPPPGPRPPRPRPGSVWLLRG